MTMRESVRHWVRLADYDWRSAHAMFESKRYLYVGFMCHQVVEKLYKVLYTRQHAKIAPYTHDLIKLASQTVLPPDEAAKGHLNTLNPLYIKCRYPSYKMQISKILTHSKAREIMKNTGDLRIWLKSQIR